MSGGRDIVERNDPWSIDHYHLPAAAAGEPGANTPVLDFPTLIQILRDWKWLILGLGAAGIALAITYTLLTTPLYRSWVTLEVSPPTVEVMDEKSQDTAAPATWELVATQVGLLGSRSVAERASQELNLANNEQFIDQSLDPATRLRIATSKVLGGLEVVPPAEGRLIRFNYVSESPQLTAQVANAVAEAFINSNLQRRYEASAYARNFLQRQIGKTRAALEVSERQLVTYAQQQGIINVGGEGEAASGGDAASPAGQSLVALNQALAEATARRVAAEGAYQQTRATGATSEVTANAQSLRQSKAVLEAEYQQKRTTLKGGHPAMLSLRAQIDELNRQIGRETAIASSSRSNTLFAEYRAAASAERALQARVQQLKGAVLNLRGRSIQYAILQRDVDTNRALYDALLQRYKEIGVAGGVGAAPVSIVDRAEVPSGPFKPNHVLNVLIGLALGLLTGMFAAVGLELLNDTIKTREDIRKKLGLACLGAIPKQPRKETLLEGLQDPSSAIAEAYSTIVASLRFSTDHGWPKTLLITSARASEGKSSSALALAQNLSRRGRRVLLVDADLRKPAFTSPTKNRGLASLLTSDEAISTHVIATQFENLWLLPAGAVPPNPADLISGPRIQKIFREASGQFDVVIVDAPPVLGLADAPLLAYACKDVMLNIESGKTRTPAAIDAINRLRAAGGQILGATLTKATQEIVSYGYGYGYRHGAIDSKTVQINLIEHSEVS